MASRRFTPSREEAARDGRGRERDVAAKGSSVIAFDMMLQRHLPDNKRSRFAAGNRRARASPPFPMSSRVWLLIFCQSRSGASCSCPISTSSACFARGNRHGLPSWPRASSATKCRRAARCPSGRHQIRICSTPFRRRRNALRTTRYVIDAMA